MLAFAISLLVVLYFVRAQNVNTAVVNLNQLRSSAKHYANGWIYGMPLNYNPNQIPDSFYSGLNFQYGRAGGAQEDAPCRGWAFGFSEYQCRFHSTMLNYQQTRKFGASFIILPHDIWGDNGNWTSYDNFLNQLISDLKANNMLSGLVWDIWNEPDLGGFWGASQQQWLNMYIRTHKRLRSDTALNGVQISGPTLANYPSVTNSWWTNWAGQTKGNNTIPDQYAWHHEGGGDLALVAPNFYQVLKQYSLPNRTVNINEYALLSEMVPSGYAWYIARFERLGWYGLLGIWNAPLYDNFANLLTKYGNPQDPANTQYTQAAGWWIYNYYGRIQAGTPISTLQSTDGNWDVYATLPAVGDNIRMLCGGHGATGTYYLQINSMSSAGYPTSGTVQIYYYRFNSTGNVFDPISSPQNLGSVNLSYSNNQVTIGVGIENANYAYGVEFVRKG